MMRNIAKYGILYKLSEGTSKQQTTHMHAERAGGTPMGFDGQLVSDKLKRWENYLAGYRLPDWDFIPDIGLYMEQLIPLMQGYLNYLPPDIREEPLITPATVNNYVRKGLMPEPRKKRYYREHVAYLLIICTLKQSLPLSALGRVLPPKHDDIVALAGVYTSFIGRHRAAADTFLAQMRAYAPLDENGCYRPATEVEAASIALNAALICGFSKLLAEKLILLGDKALATPAGEGVASEDAE